MDIYTLLKNAGYGTDGITNHQVEFITDDNRKVRSGSVFVCITGTNGKTTTAFLIKSILDNCGCKTGLIGTVKNLIGDKEYPAALTTPGPFDLNELFARMVEAECKYCVMEVSSQALSQKRVAGIYFGIAAFTNLTQDHLDYHGTFENYALAKRILFSQCDTAVVNKDDGYSAFMTEKSSCKVVSFSTKSSEADFYAKDITYSPKGIEYVLSEGEKEYKVSVGIPGEFTVYNSMCALACAVSAGISEEKAVNALAIAKGVPGRIEVVPTDTDYTVVIDYSHTPDALENILSSLRKITHGRLIAVFGCGGDRDAGKRPIMGKIAAEMADFVVVTSDNPRSEDPDKIVEQVAAGAEGTETPLVKIVDRTQAIRFAMKNARKGDVILLAGKGHETYQILNTGKIHYDEREIVAEALRLM